ncbi:fimbria/pilus outer membrane usher protein [Klebsiella pneumoniae]|nr:fimbria/pilus outer membrane usher protein [Klebsiella pneumoniae]
MKPAFCAANSSLRTDYAYLNASASAGRHQRQYSLGASGLLAAHQGGMTATRELGETFAIVEAPGAVGARVANRLGQPINRTGVYDHPLPLIPLPLTGWISIRRV